MKKEEILDEELSNEIKRIMNDLKEEQEIEIHINSANLRQAAWITSSLFELVDNELPLEIYIKDVKKSKKSVMLVIGFVLGVFGSYYINSFFDDVKLYEKTKKILKKLLKRLHKLERGYAISKKPRTKK